MSDIVVIGSSNTDMVVKVDHLPRPGETVLGGEFCMAAGGKGANQAVAAARAGGRVAFVARVGCDSFGEQAVSGFIEDGIDVSHVSRDSAVPSGVALIMVDNSGENSIAVASGANMLLSPADVSSAGDVIGKASVVITQLETPLETVRSSAEAALACGAVFILNPAPARELDDNLLEMVTVITPNETEAELLTGIRVHDAASAQSAAGVLISKGVKTVIITMGKQGAFIMGGDICRHVDGFIVKPVDTTAAGDVFNGALAVALAEGCHMVDAVHFANAAAAISVTRLGAQPSVPARAEIDALLQSRGGDAL